MPKEHKEEARLLKNYNAKPDYYSPSRPKDITRVMLTVDAPCSGDMLDVGCGDGRGYHYAYKHGMTYNGIDYSETRIAKARETQGQIPNNPNRPTFVCGDLYEVLPSINPAFDLIWCCELLEHLEEPEIIWGEMLRLNGGMIVASVPVDMPHENHLSVFKTEEEVLIRFPSINTITRMSFETPGKHQREHFIFTA